MSFRWKSTGTLRRKIWVLGCGILFAQNMGFLNTASAQVIPPAGQPGIQEKLLRERRPTFKPPEEQILDIQIEDSRTVKDAGAGPSFLVRKIVIEGNTLFDDETLGPIVDIGEGLEVTLGVLTLMVHEITAYYAQEGYILARAFIPEQEIKDGVVRIRVLEGRVGEVQVMGNERFNTEDILDRMKPVQEEPIFNKNTLEKTLLQLNDIVGLTSKTTLKPGQKFGTSDVLLEVTESRPYRFSFDGDNFGSRFTGEERYGITGIFGSTLIFGDQFSFRAVQSNDEQLFLNPVYILPLNNYGSSLKFSYTFSEFNLGDSLAALNSGGKANIASFVLNHVVHRERTSEFHVRLGGELRYFENGILGQDSSNDKIQNVYFAFSGFLADFLDGRTFYNFRFQQGFGETDVTDPLNSRFLGRGDVLIAKMEIQRFQSAFFLNSYFMLQGRGQWVDGRVLSPDLFPIGGYGSVRGYPLAEAAGDNGYTLTVEYVLPFPFKIPLSDKPQMRSLDQVVSLFGFLDHGEIFVKDPQPGETDVDMNGAGFGVRVNIPQWGPNYPSMSFSVAIGYPVLNGAKPSDGSSNTIYLGGVITY